MPYRQKINQPPLRRTRMRSNVHLAYSPTKHPIQRQKTLSPPTSIPKRKKTVGEHLAHVTNAARSTAAAALMNIRKWIAVGGKRRSRRRRLKRGYNFVRHVTQRRKRRHKKKQKRTFRFRIYKRRKTKRKRRKARRR